MGATTDKIKGATNEAIGKAKQGIGEATGSYRCKGGVFQEVKASRRTSAMQGSTRMRQDAPGG